MADRALCASAPQCSQAGIPPLRAPAGASANCRGSPSSTTRIPREVSAGSPPVDAASFPPSTTRTPRQAVMESPPLTIHRTFQVQCQLLHTRPGFPSFLSRSPFLVGGRIPQNSASAADPDVRFAIQLLLNVPRFPGPWLRPRFWPRHCITDVSQHGKMVSFALLVKLLFSALGSPMSTLFPKVGASSASFTPSTSALCM